MRRSLLFFYKKNKDTNMLKNKKETISAVTLAAIVFTAVIIKSNTMNQILRMKWKNSKNFYVPIQYSAYTCACGLTLLVEIFDW